MIAPSPGSWFAAVDYAENKQCFERQRTGSCSCTTRRSGYNPCDLAQDVIDSCDALSRGFPPSLTVVEVARWFAAHRCHNPRCNHKACSKADQIVAFLQEEAQGDQIA
jgi:hypothetical protein